MGRSSMDNNTVGSTIQIHRIFKELMNQNNIRDMARTFIQGVNSLINISYVGILISKQDFQYSAGCQKSHIIIGHNAPFHNALWNKMRDYFSESYRNFIMNNEEGPVFAFECNDVEIDVIELSGSKPLIKNMNELDVIFQMPLVIRDTIIGVMIFVDHKKTELSQNELTIIGLISDQFSVVSENFLLVEEIKEIAITDGLTGLYNRRYFMERLKEDFSRTRRFYTPLSLAMIDIDHFKRVNDQYGHQAGDQVLVRLASIFKNKIRSIDIIARYGGEEFILLLPHTEMNEAILAVKRIKKQIEVTDFYFKRERIHITVSFGISAYPLNQVKTLDEFIKTADSALYQAKEMRNCICTYAEDTILTLTD